MIYHLAMVLFMGHLFFYWPGVTSPGLPALPEFKQGNPQASQRSQTLYKGISEQKKNVQFQRKLKELEL